MVKVRNFDEKLERSFEKLGRQIEEERKLPEARELPEREIVKRSLKSLTPPPVAQQEEKVQKMPPREGSALPDYLQEGGDEKVKKEVEGLVGLVFDKGLEEALEEAGKHPAFVEDAFHDALVDKLLPELKRKGIIE